MALCIAVSAAGCGLIGCGSRSAYEFDKLDIAPARDDLTEFSLGRYEIPIPVVEDRTNDRAQRVNRLEFGFELYALVGPGRATELADSWQRHQGKIRDRVIRVCRDASLDELQEPELATLKARLMDAVGAQLGERQVRRLLITDVASQEL